MRMLPGNSGEHFCAAFHRRFFFLDAFAIFSFDFFLDFPLARFRPGVGEGLFRAELLVDALSRSVPIAVSRSVPRAGPITALYKLRISGGTVIPRPCGRGPRPS